MASRVAWAAGHLSDGGKAEWLRAQERSRLRRRLSDATSVEVAQRWLKSRSIRTVRYQVGASDVEALLAVDGVVRTGVSAAAAYDLGLGAGGDGDAYVTAELADRLVRDYFLIEASTGNLTLRLVDHDLHLASGRTIDWQCVSPRLVIGVDLADDYDTRTKRAGRRLLTTVLAEQRWR